MVVDGSFGYVEYVPRLVLLLVLVNHFVALVRLFVCVERFAVDIESQQALFCVGGGEPGFEIPGSVFR